MRTIFDMMNDPKTGNLMAQMAREYGIAQEQAQAGMAALMPAFAEGMRRSMSDPQGFAKLIQAYGELMQAGTSAAISNVERGNAVLGQLFGSKELSRAVAGQAAQATGLSTAILKAMLPAMAPKIMEILFGQLFGGARAGENPFGRMLEQMMGGAMAGGAAGQNPWGKMFEDMMRQGTGSSGAANPWGKAFEEMMRGGTSGAGDNPLGKMFEEMMGGGVQARSRQKSGEKQGRGPMEEMIGDMFDTGRTMQRDYQKNVESIFDQFVQGMKKG
jgi:hypothetical protein